jgi:hypothetical protein
LTVNDWGKLKQLLKYIQGTIYTPLILRAESLNIIKWWVDASFATHNDCGGKRGGGYIAGKRFHNWNVQESEDKYQEVN